MRWLGRIFRKLADWLDPAGESPYKPGRVLLPPEPVRLEPCLVEIGAPHPKAHVDWLRMRGWGQREWDWLPVMEESGDLDPLPPTFGGYL